ncbi:MAG: carbamoyl phosphate synthase small subunit, partial [Gammaproteobacteria bacterium]|nr:carbamoyl phosphate synthase small subunit [Gammaproteobacteria bacterium]
MSRAEIVAPDQLYEADLRADAPPDPGSYRPTAYFRLSYRDSRSDPLNEFSTETHLSTGVFTVLLEDGTAVTGSGFGASKSVGGEVVFNTGMSGYVETLTDPSYRGQILLLTYPLVGNYGVPGSREPGSLDPPFESNRIQVQGLIVQSYVASHSHHASKRSLGEWLKAEGVPAVTGIDTRAITRRLREQGTMRGWLLPGVGDDRESPENAETLDMQVEVFRAVAPPEPVRYPGGDLEILLVDVGAKDNIVRSLLSRGVSVNRVPWHADLSRHAARADGIVIGNGPGDPKDLGSLVSQVRGLLGGFGKPIFGICLGNQIMALAAGA